MLLPNMDNVINNDVDNHANNRSVKHDSWILYKTLVNDSFGGFVQEEYDKKPNNRNI